MSSENFLARWSKRKRAARSTELPPDHTAPPSKPSDAAPEATVPGEDTSLAETESSAEEVAALPRIEDLTAETDVTAFLHKGVPAAVRNAALRRAWALDPSIRDYVGDAREYAYDWNVPGGVPGFGGPLPPPEEVERLAAKIVGVMKPGTEPLSEPEQLPETPSDASQKRESSSLETECTSDATPGQMMNEPERTPRTDCSSLAESEPVEQFTAETQSGEDVADASVARARTGALPLGHMRGRRHGGAKPL